MYCCSKAPRITANVIAAAILVWALQGNAALGAELQSTTTPYPGVTHRVYADAAAPARIHVVDIDLSSSEISVHATPEAQRGTTVSEFATASGAQVVINGDFFSALDFAPAGLAMGNAEVWTNSTDSGIEGFFRFDRNGDRTQASISAPAEVVAVADLAVGTQGVIGGRPLLVRAGVALTTFDCTDDIAIPCDRSPRSAVGISSDGNRMWLVVVDGWQSGSVGLTAAELGAFMVTIGVSDALMFDGGSAATLYINGEGGLVSTPSDGVERDVANHLGVRHGLIPQGTIVGLVRERDIFDTTANIAGATVTLDDGQTTTTNADGRYSFTLTPRYACVTASKAGYRSAGRCSQVAPMDVTYNSLALFPDSDFIDAAPGAPDAGIADARVSSSDSGMTTPRDAQLGPDAGGGGGGGGCCAVGPTHEGAIGGNLLLVLLAMVPLVRRRQSPPRVP